MNILQLCNKVPYPLKDGGSIAILNLARGFAAGGNSVTILAMNTAKHYCKIESIPNDITNSMSIIAVDIDASISKTEALGNLLFSKIPYTASRFISDNYKSKLISLLTNNKYDVIQLEGLYLTSYIETIRKYSDAIISLRAHNIEHEIWQRVANGTKNVFKKIYLRNLVKRIYNYKINILNKYDVLVPITGRDNKIFEKLGNKKPAHVSQTGIFINELVPRPEKIDYPTLFAIGAMDWAPNQEGLIWFVKNVWGQIQQKYPNLLFYVAGRNAPDWFQKVLKETTGLVYLGEVDDAHEFINSKAIMIVPLLSGSGMRIKIVEGMALQKCIVTTSIGTEGITTSNEQNILIADDSKSFANAILSVLENKELFDNLSKNARIFIEENYNNLTISNKLAEFYKTELISNSRTKNE